jgi:hypothetical protein
VTLSRHRPRKPRPQEERLDIAIEELWVMGLLAQAAAVEDADAVTEMLELAIDRLRSCGVQPPDDTN